MIRNFGRAAVAAVMMGVIGIGAAQADVSRSVPMTLSVQPTITFSVQAKNISDNQDASGMSFGPLASGQNFALANQYVELTVTAPGVNWKIRSYTNNGPLAGQAYRSGLVGLTDSTAHLPTKWYVADAPIVGGPQFNDGPSTDQFTWQKDPGDQDWNPSDEYLTAVNGTGSTGTIVNGANAGSVVSSPLAYYVGAVDLANAPSQAYAGTVVFDLIQL